MEKNHKDCQSCGMPLNKDPMMGGTEADGSKSNMYCSYCYENGVFKWPDCTAAQMQQYAKDKLVKMGFPDLMAGMLTKGIPKLERWQS